LPPLSLISIVLMAGNRSHQIHTFRLLTGNFRHRTIVSTSERSALHNLRFGFAIGSLGADFLLNVEAPIDLEEQLLE